MKFLIVGLGSISRRHFRNLIALGEKDKSVFKEVAGELLIKWNYEKDSNW